MTHRIRRISAGLVFVAMVAGCGDDNGPSEEFVVTGTIQNDTEAPIPANARVLVVWAVSSTSPDYSYVFGEGTLDASAGTFRISLDQPPPTQALNNDALGVGIIVVTTSQSVATGDDISSVPESELIGAAGQYAIISVTDPEQATQFRSWADQFDVGYGVGVGVQVPGDLDQFEPTSASSVVLIIDDLANIDFVNWT